MKLIDANILLRLFLEDDQRQAEAVEKLLRGAFQDKKKLFVSDLTIAEVVWILEKKKSMPPDVISRILQSALEDERLHFEHQQRLLTALAWYGSRKVDFIDAYQAALVQEKKLEAVVSFDRDFSRLPVPWENPEK
jgi:predicted nucleic-acid-binding protein